MEDKSNKRMSTREIIRIMFYIILLSEREYPDGIPMTVLVSHMNKFDVDENTVFEIYGAMRMTDAIELNMDASDKTELYIRYKNKKQVN